MCISGRTFRNNVILCVLDLPAAVMKKVYIFISNFKTRKKPLDFLSNVPDLKHSRFPDPQINLCQDGWKAFKLSKLKICHRPPPPINKTAQWLIGSFLDAITCTRWSLRLSPWKLVLSADTTDQLCYLSIDPNSSRALDPCGGCYLHTKAAQEKR